MEGRWHWCSALLRTSQLGVQSSSSPLDPCAFSAAPAPGFQVTLERRARLREFSPGHPGVDVFLV